jgi:pilus assembly protein CpaB
MLLRITVFVLMACGLAGFATVAWISLQPSSPSPPVAIAPPLKHTVLVAAHQLRAGNLLQPEDLTSLELLDAQVPMGFSPDTPAGRSLLIGAMIRRGLALNDPLLPADVMRPGEHGFLAAVLGAGMRAVTIGVDAVSGSAGLIWPGDRVDLILTQALEDPTLPMGHRVAGETVLPDLRVIAIDQQLVQGAQPGVVEVNVAHTVTLEVTPQQAERVAVASRLGRLSLVVRAADKFGGSPLGATATTWGGDVSPALGIGPNAGGLLRLFQGQAEGKEFRF